MLTYGQSKSFIDIANPKAVLENTLRSFSALTRGSTIRIHYNQKQVYAYADPRC